MAKFSRANVVGAVLGMAVLVALGILVRESMIRSKNERAARLVDMLILEFMLTHDDAWPRSWKDLQAPFDSPQSQLRDGSTFEELQDRIEVDWNADPKQIVKAIESDSILKIIRPRDGRAISKPTEASTGWLMFHSRNEPPFRSPETRKIVENPDKVQAFRLMDVEDRGERDLASFPTTGDAIDVPPDIAAKIATKLLDYKSYMTGSPKACGNPIYGVRVSYSRGDHRVDVLFCFLCDDLAVFREGQLTGKEAFDPARAVLLTEVKRILPMTK